MKADLVRALKIFRTLSVVFIACFFIYLIWAEFISDANNGFSTEDIWMWMQKLLIYYLVFAIYYWVICAVFITIYRIATKSKKEHP